MNGTLPSPVAPDRRNGWLLGLAAAIPLSFALLHCFFAPPLLSHDSTIGLQVWQSMEQGSAWNELATPDPVNIAQSTRSFLTWWSPGQYLPIGVLTKLGLPLGAAMLLTSLVGAWSLSFGLWHLVLAVGSSARTAALAALAASCTWHTLYEFGFFIGGEIALLAVWPWILLLASQTRQRPVLQCGLLPLLFIAGSMAKLSFGLYAIGLLAFLWWTEATRHDWQWRAVVLGTLRYGAILVLYAVAWHFIFVRHGPSPVSSHTARFAPLAILGFAGNAPWFAATGFGSLAGRISLLQGIDSDAGWTRWAPVLVVVSVAAMAVYVFLFRSRTPLLRLAGIVSLASAALFALLLLRGAAISLEDRHLRPAGVLLLAVAAHFVHEATGFGRFVAVAALGLAMAFGIGSALQRLGNMRAHAVRTADGRSMLDIDVDSVRFLEAADQPGTLVYVPRVQMASLVRRGRVWAEESVANDAAALRSPSRHGRVPSLLLAVPAEFSADGRAQALQASFADYRPSEWRLVRHGQWDFWQAVTP